MNDNNIEDILRQAKPVVKDDPTFLMETRRRMEQVEGIKKEVDRQHRKSRIILIATLATGLVVGMLAMALVFLYPSLFQGFDSSFLAGIKDFLVKWKQFLPYPVAAIAVALSLVLTLKPKESLS